MLKPLRSIGPEGDAELRQSSVRSLESVLASAAVTLAVETLAACRYPGLAVVWRLAIDVALSIVRIPVIAYLLVATRPGQPGRMLPAWAVDAFTCAGAIWSALVGIGCALCLATHDPGLSILAVLVAMGTIGGLGVRSPGSPRLNIVQMCMVTLPLTCGLLASTIPMTNWAVILAPLYLFGMIRITRQLHLDYERMIVARLDNRRRAFHCSLTELPNRAFFADALTLALNRPDDLAGNVTVMYLDLDGFKAVNDSLGHGAGDALLTQVADRLRDLPSRNAFVARLGGDEFAILLHGHGSSGVEALARDVIDSVARPYDLGEARTVRVGVSIGLASAMPGMDVEAIIRGADEALYAAKRDGRGTFRWVTQAAIPASLPPARMLPAAA